VAIIAGGPSPGTDRIANEVFFLADCRFHTIEASVEVELKEKADRLDMLLVAGMDIPCPQAGG